MNKFLHWAKKQSTWKAMAVLAGVVGYNIAPERVGEVLTAVGVVYGGIAAFWDKE